MTGIELKMVLAALFLALGLTVPMPEFFAGMFLGLGCCYAVMIFTPPTDRKSLWATLFVGFLSALLVAIMHPHLKSAWLWGAIPLQVQMALSGAVSRGLAKACITFGDGLAEWARALPSKWKLPGDEK